MRPGDREYGYPRRQGRVVVPGSSDSNDCHRIKFVVEEVVCEVLDEYGNVEIELHVRVRWTHYTGGCRKTPPGVNEYDGLIDVYDSCVLAYFLAEDLIGKAGSATYFYPRQDSSYDNCVPQWIIDALCGSPQCE